MPVGVDGQDFAGGRSAVRGATPRAEQLDLAARRLRRVRPGRGSYARMMRETVAASAVQSTRAIGAIDFGGVGRLRVVLRRLRRLSDVDQRQRLDQRERSHLGEAKLQLAVGLVVGNRRADLEDDRAGVERFDHAHDRDARLGVAVANRGLDRRRAAERRQQRRMDVDRAEPRQVDDVGRRQDVPVGDDDGDVGLESREAAR